MTDTDETASWNNRKDWETVKKQANFHDKSLETAFSLENAIVTSNYRHIMFISSSTNLLKPYVYKNSKG